MKLRHLLFIMMLGFVSENALSSDDNPDRDARPLTLSKVSGADFSEGFKWTTKWHLAFDGAHVVANRIFPQIFGANNPLATAQDALQVPRFALLAMSLGYATGDAILTKSKLTFFLLAGFIMHGLGDVKELCSYPVEDIYVAVCLFLTTAAISRTIYMADPVEVNEVPAESNKGSTRSRSKSSGRRK